jgi:hypothetical protein
MVGIIDLTDNRFGYNQKGFTSIINQIIEMCLFHYEKYNDFKIYVSDPRVEVFFNLPKIDFSSEESYIVSNEYLEMFFKNGFPDYNAHNIVNEHDIQIRNFIFNNVFKLKDEITFDYEPYDIGIHIRGTDKKNEIPEISISNIISKLNSVINQTNEKPKIFIATDDYIYINGIKEHINDLSITYYNDNVISHDGNPIHFIDDRKIIDYQVLRDVYTLKNCKNLFYCYSNVSLMSIMIGYSSYEQKILLN